MLNQKASEKHYLLSGRINLAFLLLVLLVGSGVDRQSLLPSTKSQSVDPTILNVDLKPLQLLWIHLMPV